MVYVIVVLLMAALIGARLLVARQRLGGFHAGDFVKVAIPRTVDRPLAMGTRLDIAEALRSRGIAVEELRPLLDGKHDQELCDRYWSGSTA